MADENQSDADKAEQAKIKELEDSLAKELDQQVNLTRPTDSRIEGQIEVNPSISADTSPRTTENAKTYESIPKERAPEAPAASTQPPAPKADAQEISLEDLDSLLAQEAPDLKAEIESLKKAGEDPNIKSVDLSATDVDGVVEEPHDLIETPKQKLNVKQWVLNFIKKSTNRVLDFLYQAPIKGFKYTVKFVKEDLRIFVAGRVQILKYRWGKIRAFFGGFRPVQWMAFATMFLTTAALVYVLLGPHFHINLGFKFHPGFAQADFDEKFEFDQKKPFVPISEEGEYPQFVVLLDKVIVNIQPSENSSANPMVAMRLYFESNSRQGTVELKDREKEVRDRAQRVLETFTYDQIVTARGKLDFKEQLRREITSIMNTGIVKNIFIDDILIKP